MLYREIIEGIFSIGLFINALSFIPQIIRLLKERSSKDLSFFTFLIFFITQLSAVLYGFIIQNKIIIVGYILSMLTCGPVVFLIAYFRKKSSGYSEASANITGIDFQDIIQQAPVHIYWKDLEGKCLGCSDLQLKSLGMYSRKDYLGKDDYDLHSIQDATKIVAVDKAVLRTDKLHIIEELTNDKKLLYLSYKTPLRDKHNRTVGLLGVSMNIAEARHQEIARKELLENIIALMPGHIYWIDRAGIYQGCNDEQAKSAGLQSRGDIVGMSNADLPWELCKNNFYT